MSRQSFRGLHFSQMTDSELESSYRFKESAEMSLELEQELLTELHKRLT